MIVANGGATHPPDAVKLPPRVVLASDGELLRHQLRWRAIVAGAVGATVALLQLRGWLAGAPLGVAGILAAYVATASLAASLAPSHARSVECTATPLAAYATIIADVVALLAVTWLVTPRAGHDWVLVVGFFIVHLAGFSYGRGASILGAIATAGGYLALYAMRPDASAGGWTTTALAAGAFTVVVCTFLAQYTSRRRRLRRIITLFQRAEEGDLTEEYDVAADRRPDVVTAVGGAYNRVRARFENLVLTDALTGCLNRRGLDQALDRELARAERASSEVAMLAIDIDHFKDVNDSYGHMAGDETLEQFGRLLLASVRTGDIVGRVGGDEFVILCPDTGIEGARMLAASLCQFVATHPFDGHGAAVLVTISAGVAAIEATAADHTASELKLRADRALYDAKHAGRNRVRCWEQLASA